MNRNRAVLSMLVIFRWCRISSTSRSKKRSNNDILFIRKSLFLINETYLSEEQKGSGRRWSARFCPSILLFLRILYLGRYNFGKFGKPLRLEPFCSSPGHYFYDVELGVGEQTFRLVARESELREQVYDVVRDRLPQEQYLQ